ncbi:MAG TPA: VapE family protein [Tenuifilaceae bacterium]|nr:VapE family protein [Tenuifilaceae bacterium]
MSEHLVSFFESVLSKQKEADIPIEALIFDIKNGKYAKQIFKIRAESDKRERENQKKKLPASTISCTTKGSHKASDVNTHSGLLQVDIDEVNPSEALNLKVELAKDPYIYSCFLSPSEKLKSIIRIVPDIKLQTLQAESAATYFKERYKVNIDKACKDITRMMYVSYDKDLYYNPDSVVFDKTLISQPRTINFNQQQLDAVFIIEEIEKKKTDITGNYEDWIKIIFSLIQIFGNECKEYIHRVSSYYSGYSYLDTEKQINACLSSTSQGITGSTFFHYAKKHGFILRGVPVENSEAKQPSQISRIKRYIQSKYDTRFNSVSLELEFKRKQDFIYSPLNENSLLIELLENGYNISASTFYALLKSDFIRTYDPFEEYFQHLSPWDGTDYIEKLASSIKAKDQKSFNNHFKKWLVRVVACALQSDFYNKQALILIGEQQNTGKSTWCRFLCPPSLNKYIAENISTDKDSRILLAKNLLINLDELALMGKSDLNSLKAYFSKTMINERLPWGKTASIITRRCSFVGSTNQNEFLNDETVSVRWLCFEINAIDWEYKTNIDINKVYAQAYYLFKSNTFNYNLTKEEIKENEKRNKEYQMITIERELIEKYIELGKIERGFYTATDIVLKLNELTNRQFSLSHIHIGKALKMLGYERVKQRSVYGYIINQR